MALIDFNPQPTKRQLRQFGVTCVFALPTIMWVWTQSTMAAIWAGGIGVLLCSLGLVLPQLLKPVFAGLMMITMPIGMVVGELALMLIYFGLFLPMAILFRLIGRDSLQRRSAHNEKTFWQKRIPVSSIRKYYQQS